MLLLRSCEPGGKSYGGYIWDLTVGAENQPERWSPNAICGNGLHGLLWGRGDVNLTNVGMGSVWVAFSAAREDVVNIGTEKSKVRVARVEFVSEDRAKVAQFIADRSTKKIGSKDHFLKVKAGKGQKVVVGDYGTAIVGDGGTAVAGVEGTAIAGDKGTARVTGDGTAKAGAGGTVSILGHFGTARVGVGGKIRAGYRAEVTFERPGRHVLKGEAGNLGMWCDESYYTLKNGKVVRAR